MISCPVCGDDTGNPYPQADRGFMISCGTCPVGLGLILWFKPEGRLSAVRVAVPTPWARTVRALYVMDAISGLHQRNDCVLDEAAFLRSFSDTMRAHAVHEVLGS